MVILESASQLWVVLQYLCYTFLLLFCDAPWIVDEGLIKTYYLVLSNFRHLAYPAQPVMSLYSECCRLRESSLAKVESNPTYVYKHNYLEGSLNRSFNKIITVEYTLGHMNSVDMELWQLIGMNFIFLAILK